MSKIITNIFTKKIAEAVKSELSSNLYYFAVSKHTTWGDENNPNTAINTTQKINDFHKELILGKRIKASDITSLINRNLWQTGTVYDQYDDRDKDLYSKAFYVINGSENVYKCLYNNNGEPSTIEPTSISTGRFDPGDGYQWKYMYSISSANNTKFSLSSYIPVDPNTTITAAASNGAIDVVFIDNGGAGYLGYATGYIAEVLSNTLFRVESTVYALSSERGFYNRSGFYIGSGTGAEQLSTISDYYTNAVGHYVVTADQFNSPALDLTSTFRISPQILITGDGSGAKAICTVNTTSGSYFIDYVEVKNQGSNYSFANVSVLANPSYGTGASLRAVIPPPGGHGADVATELGSNRLGVSVLYNNTENYSISTDVPFRQGAIISIPYKFTAPETYKTFNALTNVSNTNDTIAIANASTNYFVGDKIQYIVDAGNTAIGGMANGIYYYVLSSNTTAITLSTSYEGSLLNLTAGTSESGHRLYTTTLYNSNTFNALTYLTTSAAAGTFQRNEVVVGATSNATASIAFANTTMIKVSYTVGTFANAEIISGQSSGATATITNINKPDIQPYTSSVLYIDNVQVITRADDKFEQAYLVLNV